MKTTPAIQQEPCLGCGEETAIGSPLYATRHETVRGDGPRAFLCEDCAAREREANRPERPRRVNTAVAAAVGLQYVRHWK